MTFLLGMLRRLPEGYAEPKSDEKTVRMAWLFLLSFSLEAYCHVE